MKSATKDNKDLETRKVKASGQGLGKTLRSRWQQHIAEQQFSLEYVVFSSDTNCSLNWDQQWQHQLSLRWEIRVLKHLSTKETSQGVWGAL